MKTIKRRFSIMFFLVIVCFLYQCSGSAHSQESTPNAEYIIDKHIEATGGKTAHEKINNCKAEMKIKYLRTGQEYKLTHYKEKPNLFYSVFEENFMGNTIKVEEAGTDGNIVWALENGTDGIIVKEEERANLLIDYAFDALASWRTYFKDAQCVGLEDINGKQCYKIVMTPFQGDQRIYFFENETFFLVKMIISPPKIDPDIEKTLIPKIKEKYGEVPLTQKDMIELYLSDYRKDSDILIPHNILEISGGYEIFIINIENFKTNIDIPKGQFALPESIRHILDPYNPKGGLLI